MNPTSVSGAETFTDVLFSQLEGELPPVFPRKAVSKLLGGVICAGTLANLGSQGPPFIRMGKHAVYERTSFLRWLRTKASSTTGADS